jgi:hypothetical protein
MRAIADGNRFCESYFIIMDRLYQIMDKKLECWGKALIRTIGMSAKVFDRSGQKAKALLTERLVAAFDLCSAIQYLHNRKIIYRDIKVSGKQKQYSCISCAESTNICMTAPKHWFRCPRRCETF